MTTLVVSDRSVTLTPDPGNEYERKYHTSRYVVGLDGQTIGIVYRRMFTRERRGRGMRYVYARWESWGWTYGEVTSHGVGFHFGKFECCTRQRGIEILVERWLGRGER